MVETPACVLLAEKSLDLLEKSLADNCADFIGNLCQDCAAARILEFKKEFSSVPVGTY